jgi:hypothetical protein
MGLVALVLIAAACTGSSTETTDTTAPEVESASPSTTRSEADPSGSDFEAGTGDPLDLLDGFDVEALSDEQLDISNRLDELPSELFDADQRRLVRSGDAEIVVASLLPAGQGRGDPGLADAVAAGVAGNLFADPEFVDIEGRSARRLFVDGTAWYFWASNTHLFIGAGETDVVEEVFAELMDVASKEYLWREGDCLGFEDDGELPFAPFGTFELVECESAHSHEVTLSEVLDEGSDDPFPADLDERVDLICGEAFVDHVGAVPRLTTLRPVTYRPDQSEWAEGDRYMACVVGAPSDGEFTESIESGAAEYERTVLVGDCVSDNGTVDCGDVHWGEIIAIPTHPGDTGDPYPGDEEIADVVDAECREALAEVATTSGDLPINVQARGLTAFDWGAGSRQFECLAFVTQDGQVPSDVIGSFTGEWRTVGEGIVV